MMRHTMTGKANVLTLSVVVLTVATGCNLGEVGLDLTICAQAAQHVASCTGSAAPQVDQTSCNAEAAAKADQVLQMSCADMGNDNERSPMFFNGLLCQLLPFLCAPNTNSTAGGLFRIKDCFQLPGKGWCYDMMKLRPGGACTQLMTYSEWRQSKFTLSQCLQPQGGLCRLARVCQNFQNKGQCVKAVQHRYDRPSCQKIQAPRPRR